MIDRSDYTRGGLELEGLDTNPLKQLSNWLEQAQESSLVEYNAMCLSTVGEDGGPSSRMVLLRGVDDAGLTFFTNYDSRKGNELSKNPSASLCFWWGALERQVRVEGRCERVAPSESDDYFASRPFESQLASSASPQSAVVASREELEAIVETLRKQHPVSVPRPKNWGGFRLVPDVFEFWQGRPARLHDRFRYRREDEKWLIERLAP